MILYLIGMMGCGKTTVGKYLASQLKYSFVDIDFLIEEKCSLKVHEIINQYGIEYFRHLESEALIQLDNNKHTVVSTGGGILLNENNITFMKNNGLMIYLNVSIDELKKRLNDSELMKRPLLKVNTLDKIYEERKEAYLFYSDLMILCEDFTVKEISQHIISLLEKKAIDTKLHPMSRTF